MPDNSMAQAVVNQISAAMDQMLIASRTSDPALEQFFAVQEGRAPLIEAPVVAEATPLVSEFEKIRWIYPGDEYNRRLAIKFVMRKNVAGTVPTRRSMNWTGYSGFASQRRLGVIYGDKIAKLKREGKWAAVVRIASDDLPARAMKRVTTAKEREAYAIANAGRQVPDFYYHDAYAELGRGFGHALHVAESDPTKWAYAENIDKLLARRFTVAKPGRYLAKYYGDVLSGAEIKDIVEDWNLEVSKEADCNTLKFIPNTEPDKWEWAYEHAHGFTSCMMYDKPSTAGSRNLDSRCCGENHPVRTYANPENTLALAYLGNESVVYARCVVNTADKTFYRVYGDDRLKKLLVKEGYHYSEETLAGQPLVYRLLNGDQDSPIAPYTDGIRYILVDHDEKTTTMWTGCESDPHNYCTSANGIACWDTNDAYREEYGDEDDSVECEHCEEYYDADELRQTYRSAVEGYGHGVCPYCSNDHYVYANTRHGEYRVNINDTTYCESDGEYYLTDDVVAGRFALSCCVATDEWYLDRDMVMTSAGMVWEECDDLVELTYPDSDGNDWALEVDVQTYTHKGVEITVHDDSVDDYPEDEDDDLDYQCSAACADQDEHQRGVHEFHTAIFDQAFTAVAVQTSHDQYALAA